MFINNLFLVFTMNKLLKRYELKKIKMKSQIPELTNHEFEEFIKEGLALIDFFDERSMSCLTTSPIIEEINEKFGRKVKIAKVNVEDDPEHVQKFRVHTTPTLLLLKDGQIIDNLAGEFCCEEIEERIKRYIRNLL